MGSAHLLAVFHRGPRDTLRHGAEFPVLRVQESGVLRSRVASDRWLVAPKPGGLELDPYLAFTGVSAILHVLHVSPALPVTSGCMGHACVAVAVAFTSVRAMPHVLHFSPALPFTSGCMGQAWVAVAVAPTADMSMPHVLHFSPALPVISRCMGHACRVAGWVMAIPQCAHLAPLAPMVAAGMGQL